MSHCTSRAQGAQNEILRARSAALQAMRAAEAANSSMKSEVEKAETKAQTANAELDVALQVLDTPSARLNLFHTGRRCDHWDLAFLVATVVMRPDAHVTCRPSSRRVG